MKYCSFITLSVLCWLRRAKSIALLEPSGYSSDVAESDIFQIINTKEYIPKEDELPKPIIVNNDVKDASYILSKLSDENLIKLLNQEPKRNEYDINDLVKLAGNTKEVNVFPSHEKPSNEDHFSPTAFFRLEDKEVEPFNYNNDADPKHNALQYLNNLLYSRQQQLNSDEDDEKREMLFDTLVAQLKSLCCKKRKPKVNTMTQLKSMLIKVLKQKKSNLQMKSDLFKIKPAEQLFLIINDEIRSLNDTEDLITVDPESLSNNSSVLLLGPITTPLSEVQLKLVMSRISNELSKPEYMPLLKKISEGVLDDSNFAFMKSLVTGPYSRRYVKPHRCNHQSKLARVYGGPKWLICTGYLNMNTPSVYD